MIYESSGPCATDFEPALDVEFDVTISRIELDRGKGIVSVIHDGGGDVELFKWDKGTFAPLGAFDGPVVDVALLGPTNGEEYIGLVQPVPPFIRISRFAR